MPARPLSPMHRRAVLDRLESQLDRVRSGLACADCEGSGERTTVDFAGPRVAECPACGGSGMVPQPRADD